MNLKKFFTNKFSVIFLLIIVFLVVIRIPSLFEPKWYGDEGIYAAVANEMFYGEKLYVDAWDHKPPAIYILYWIAKFFGTYNLVFVKIISLASAIGTLILLKKILLKFVSEKVTLITSALFAFLVGTIILEGNIANAENFFMFFTTLGFYYFLNSKSTLSLVLTGLVFSVAFLFKIHPFFEFVALVFFILVSALRNKEKLSKLVKEVFIIGTVFVAVQLASFVITGLSIGSLAEYIATVVTYNFGYTSYTETATSASFFSFNSLGFRAVLTALIFLVAGLAYYKKKISEELFLSILWLVGGLFAAFLSARPYPHYFLQVVPAYCLLTAIFLKQLNKYNWYLKFIPLLVPVVILIAVVSTFKVRLPIEYYTNSIGVMFGTVSQSTYNDYLDKKINSTELLVKFINENKNSERPTLFLWGNDAWFYDQVNADNVSRYVVDFHVGVDPVRRKELIDDIQVQKPQFLIQESGTSLFDGTTEGLGGVGLREVIRDDYNITGVDIGGRFMVYELD